MPIVDENLKMVEEARERLLKEHGGYKGLWDFLLNQDAARRKKQKPRFAKSPTSRRRRSSSTHTT